MQNSDNNVSILQKIQHALTFKSPKGTGPLPLDHIAKATGMTELIVSEQVFANSLNRLIESGSVMRRNCAHDLSGAVDAITANLVRLTGLPQWLVLTIVWWIFHHLDSVNDEKEDSSAVAPSSGLFPDEKATGLPSDFSSDRV
jgi:hypothetical protein